MTVLEIIGYAGYVVGGVIILASKTKNDNLSDLKDRVEILEKELVYSKNQLEKERADAHEQHVKNRESIAELRKEVQLYKDLQLDSIAQTNKEMLEVLKNSAVIRAQDKNDGEGLLVHTKDESPLAVNVKE